MTKLFTCLGGSHLYGTTTPSSDRDIKHIVLPDLDSLLLGKPIKNVQKKTNTEEFKKNTADDVDEEFIPLQVFARDFLGGQTYALELAYAVDGTGAEQQIHDPRFVHFCYQLRRRYLTSDIHAMSRYAAAQAEIYSAKGERLNTALAALGLYQSFHAEDVVQSRKTVFEHEALKLAEQFPLTFQMTKYDVDGKGNMRPCIKLLDRVLPYSATFGYIVKQIEGIIKKYGDRAKAATVDTVDWKATMHALRIAQEGINLLSGNGLSFPYAPEVCDYYKAIRRGEHPYADVVAKLEEKLTHLSYLADTSKYPRLDQGIKDDLEEWLLVWLYVFYGIESKQVNARPWTYVEEGLPNHGGQVQVAYSNEHNGPFITSARYEGGKWDDMNGWEVYAWRGHGTPPPRKKAVA